MSTEAPSIEPQAAEKPAEEQAAPPPKKSKTDYLAEAAMDMSIARRKLRDCKRRIVNLTSDLKDEKEHFKGLQADVNEVAERIEEISNGTYQPPLLFKKPTDGAGEATAADPADAADLAELIEFGVTSKQVELLTESQLAKELPLKTVGDLFRAIAADQWWFKKVKGLGETKRDALINATIAYREKFPVPDGDTRQKQCKDCDTIYPQTAGECPKCSSPYFNLTELEAAEQVDQAADEPAGVFRGGNEE
jgi:hypothetical protein